MTTELVILLIIFVAVIQGILGTPAQTFNDAGPKLGMRIEKELETAPGFSRKTSSAPNPVSWGKK